MKTFRLFSILTLLALILSLAAVPGAAATTSGLSPLPAPETITGPALSQNAGEIVPQCSPSCPGMKITKTADAAVVQAGDPVGFTITVASTGATPAKNVVVEDQLPLGITWTANNTGCSINASNYMTCNLGEIPGSQSVSVHVGGLSTPATCGVLKNTADGWADQIQHNYSNQAIVAVQCAEAHPDVTVTKTALDPTVAPGSVIGFTLTVTNQGAGSASGVILRDQLPSQPGLVWAISQAPAAGTCAISGGMLVCDFGSLEAGGSRVVTISSPTTANSCGTVSNTAVVSSTNEPSAFYGNNEATAETAVDCPPLVVQVVKRADINPVNAGSAIGFSITIENTGTAAVQNIQMRDQLLQGTAWQVDNAACSINAANLMTCAFGDLAAGASLTVHITAPDGSTVCGDLSNTADVWGDNLPLQSSNQSIVNINCDADVTVTKTPSPIIIHIRKDANGNPLSSIPAEFSMTVSNHGIAAATNVTLTDNLPLTVWAGQPANTQLTWSIKTQPASGQCSITANVLGCTFPSLAVGASDTVTITSPTDQIPEDPDHTSGKPPDVIFNTVSVAAANEPLANRVDNTASASITVDWATADIFCISDNPFNGKYQNDFSISGPGSKGWTNWKVGYTEDNKNNPFVGKLSNETVALEVGCLPVNQYITVSFDLYLIGSWDGDAIFKNGKPGPGPDYFKVVVSDPTAADPLNQGRTLLNTTLTNFSFFKQAYPGSLPSQGYPGRTGAVAKESLGFKYLTTPMDSTYHISLTFYNTLADQMVLFNASHLQVLWDESWGIDNVELNVANVNFLPLIQSR